MITRTTAEWRPCASCGSRCLWSDDAWTCTSCGDEWDWDHSPTYAAPASLETDTSVESNKTRAIQ